MRITYSYAEDVNSAKLPRNLKNELLDVFSKYLHIPQSRTRRSSSALSFLTQRLRCLTLVSAIELLFNVGKYELTSIRNIKEKHVEYLIKSWTEQKLSRGTLENKISYLATFACWLNKGNIVKHPDMYAEVKAIQKRSGISEQDKSWSAAGINVNEMISRIAAEDQHIGVQLMLQVEFGLRVQESMMLKPYDALSVIAGIRHISVSQGPKNNKFRKFPVLHESQERVIELAQQLISRHHKSTIPDEYTLPEWKKRHNTVMIKFGITKNQLGVTSHGLRHEHFNDLYKDLTGVDSPVRGGEAPRSDILKAARQIISEHAGHSVISKANAYIGSHAAMKAKTAKDLTNEQVLQTLKECEGNKMKAAEKLGCARSYLYKRLNEMKHPS